jgi:CheY-like chemotaxis protein
VRLPIVVEAFAPEAALSRPQPTQQSSLRVLIVDDNRDGADLLAMMLESMGNEVRVAYDGEEAVASTAAFRPDVVLLDIGLPKMNGYDACRRIRAQSDGKKLTIIAQTGWGQIEDRQRTRDAGFDHHMVKPLDPEALEKLLAGLRPPG